MLQFYFAQPIFGEIGLHPEGADQEDLAEPTTASDPDPNILDDQEVVTVPKEQLEKRNPFTTLDYSLIGIFIVSALIYIINDPLSTIGDIQTLNFDVDLGFIAFSDSYFFAALAALSFAILLLVRIPRYAPIVRDRMIAVSIFSLLTVFFWAAFEQAAGTLPIYTRDFTQRELTGTGATIFKIVDFLVTVGPLVIITYVLYALFKKTFSRISLSNIVLGTSFVIIWGIVIYKVSNEFSSTGTEVPVTWFGILNSLFIITFAPLFSKLWESKYNPPAAVKYAMGLVLLGLGFAFLAVGASGIAPGATAAQASMFWLVAAYLFHTLGELCLSPLGLSYLSKLVPPRMIAFMFGVYYLAIAIGNKVAHSFGGKIDVIADEYGISTFFWILTIIPIGLGILSALLNPLLRRLMHGVK
jgi:POT family proton-dependent oligopeptide transporter